MVDAKNARPRGGGALRIGGELEHQDRNHKSRSFHSPPILRVMRLQADRNVLSRIYPVTPVSPVVKEFL